MTKLFPYQKKSVKRIVKFKGRTLLALEMGLGKTLVALTYLRIRPEALPALVVCPASAKWVWRNEIHKHTKFKCLLLNGRKPVPIHTKHITIINYDILFAWKEVLQQLNYNTLILDESHFCKSHKSKRTKASIIIGKRIPHILALSGTPLTNRPKELYTILHLLLPKQFPSFVPYAFHYCNRRMTPWGWDDTGASHLDELHKQLKKLCMIRHLKRHVLHELPAKSRSVVPLSINIRKYAEAEENFIEWLAKKDINKAKRALQAQQLVQLGYLKRYAAELKMKGAIEWLDNFLENTDEKIVVFAYHKDIINTLSNQYKNSVIIDGSTNQKLRQANIQKFQQDKQTRIFIGQMIAAGTAITLTAASTVVFVELDWVPGNHIQAEDRLHRIGQTSSVQAYYLIAKDTIEEDLCRIIQKKAAIITSVLDGHKHKNQLNIFDKLMNKIQERNSL